VKKKPKTIKKQEADTRPFTRENFHNLLKRAVTPHAPKPAPKST
jgi:hypothetical protein